jgi:hypothetical protein
VNASEYRAQMKARKEQERKDANGIRKRLLELSAKATPGPWKAEPKRLVLHGMRGPLMSYLKGHKAAEEGMVVTIGSERIADHEFVAELVNAFRDGVFDISSEPNRGR